MTTEQELLEVEQQLQQCTAPVPPKDDLRLYLKLVRGIRSHVRVSRITLAAATMASSDPGPCASLPQSREARVPNAELVARYGTQLLSHYRRGLAEDEREWRHGVQRLPP